MLEHKIWSEINLRLPKKEDSYSKTPHSKTVFHSYARNFDKTRISLFLFSSKECFFFLSHQRGSMLEATETKTRNFRPICSIIYFAGSLTLRC